MSLNFQSGVRAFALSATLLSLSLTAHESGDSSRYDEVINLRPYTVTGALTPGDPDGTLLPVLSLFRESLDPIRSTTLGETLDGLPGLQSTAFAAGASRPIIRGFDGPRIQILQDGLPVADVSADSPDHALNITHEFAETIDVIRGPATLLYGGSAVGGVINIVGGLFPGTQQEAGTETTLASAYHTVSRGWSYQLHTQTTQGNWAVSANIAQTEFDDYDIPGYASSAAEREAFHEHEEHDEHDEHEGEELEKDRLGASFSDSLKASVALRYRLNSNWNLAGALGRQERRYGVPGHSHGHNEHEEHDEHDEHDDDHDEHDDGHNEHGSVAIDMEQWRADLELAGTWQQGWLRGLKWRMHHSDYEHQELEGDETATSFEKRLWSHRIELSHGFTDGITGVMGAQFDSVDYESSGEEALIPDMDSQTLAFFSAQRWQSGQWGLHAGGRIEWSDMDVSNGLPSYDAVEWSGAFGMDWKVSDRSKLDWVLSRSARHPSATELFADGMHAATRSYEIGDASLEREVAQGVDVRYEYQQDRWHFIGSSYFNRFENYLYAAPTGSFDHGFPVYQYVHADADFWGVEGELCWRVIEEAGRRLEFSLVGDHVSTNLLDSDAVLPRKPASRLGLVLLFKANEWTLRSDFRHVFEVDEVAVNELPTESYQIWNVYLSHEVPVRTGKLTVHLRLRNLLDEEIRSHTSSLKDLAPQPGRGAEIGMRWQF